MVDPESRWWHPGALNDLLLPPWCLSYVLGVSSWRAHRPLHSLQLPVNPTALQSQDPDTSSAGTISASFRNVLCSSLASSKTAFLRPLLAGGRFGTGSENTYGLVAVRGQDGGGDLAPTYLWQVCSKTLGP